MTSDVELKAAIERGLRKARHEEAPVPVIREHDIFHITHMVFEEVKGFVQTPT